MASPTVDEAAPLPKMDCPPLALALDRPARASQRSPKALVVRRRRIAEPRAPMVVTVNAASARAVTCCRRHLLKRRAGLATLLPRGKAAIPSHRRPVRHRRRKRTIVERGEFASRIHDLTSYDRKQRRCPSDVVLGAGKEVAVRDDKVRELTHCDLPFLADFI